jgi:hypothetical protein
VGATDIPCVPGISAAHGFRGAFKNKYTRAIVSSREGGANARIAAANHKNVEFVRRSRQALPFRMFVMFLSDIRVRKRDHELGPHYRPSIVPCQESRADLSVAHDMSGLRAARVGDHARHGFLPEGRDGAGNESTGRHLAGTGEEYHMVAGGEDSGDQRPLTESRGGNSVPPTIYPVTYFRP